MLKPETYDQTLIYIRQMYYINIDCWISSEKNYTSMYKSYAAEKKNAYPNSKLTNCAIYIYIEYILVQIYVFHSCHSKYNIIFK